MGKTNQVLVLDANTNITLTTDGVTAGANVNSTVKGLGIGITGFSFDFTRGLKQVQGTGGAAAASNTLAYGSMHVPGHSTVYAWWGPHMLQALSVLSKGVYTNAGTAHVYIFENGDLVNLQLQVDYVGFAITNVGIDTDANGADTSQNNFTLGFQYLNMTATWSTGNITTGSVNPWTNTTT